MNPKDAVQPLKELHERLSAVSGADKYIVFSAIHTIYDLVCEWCDKNPQFDTGYLLEKLSLFYSYCHYAVFPAENADKSPAEWLESAGFNLMKVEITDLRERPTATTQR